MLTLSGIADLTFYGRLTFPPARFIYFNMVQSLAGFYGHNVWHYYLSQGLPLLLTTALPWAVAGLRSQLDRRGGAGGPRARQLAWVCVAMPAALSVVSHKEVRFIYPLLPLLYVVSAPAATSLCRAAAGTTAMGTRQRAALAGAIMILVVNVVAGHYVSITHASGPDRVLAFLRNQYMDHYSAVLPSRGGDVHGSGPENGGRAASAAMTVSFLMPCHSTPWRSGLVFRGIDAWALSCEPPVDVTPAARAHYVDEADRFYAAPDAFIQHHMAAPGSRWPDYLVFFAQLEPTLRQAAVPTAGYVEAFRTWNTAWHDDWRRAGDLVVWRRTYDSGDGDEAKHGDGQRT